jgi:dipeptidyl-peptidase-4
MKNRSILLIIIFLFIVSAGVYAGNDPVEKANYKLPARFSPNKMRTLVFSTSVRPTWMKNSQRIWYIFENSEGKTFVMLDPDRKTKRPIFDNISMAAQLTEKTRDPYDAKHLPIDTIEFIKNDRAIYFKVEKNKAVLEAEKRKAEQEEKTKTTEKTEGSEEKKDKKDKKKEKSQVEKAKEEAAKYHHFEYELATGKLTMLKDFVDEPERPRWANISPDGEIIVFAKHHNLFTMDKANYEKWLNNPDDETIEEHQLTDDGEEHYSYGRGGRGETNVEKEENKDKRESVYGLWSRDSKKFALVRTDEREVKDLWVINSVAQPRPTLETYRYHMPGEKEAPQYEILVFDMASREKVKVDADRFKDQQVSILSAPYKQLDRLEDYRAPQWLAETSDKLYFSRTSRDLHRIDICVADPVSGETKVLIEERLNTYVETRPLVLIDNGRELIHWSERDGWAHFYLFDSEGNLKNQITSGPWHCNSVQGVDEKNRVLYFSANARERGEDPYYTHLYRINFDGTGLKLLNAGDFNHSATQSDDTRFFINNYSRVDSIPKAELRDSQGRVIMELEAMDFSRLDEAGYRLPETFKVKAADGITDLYGVLYKPFDFDENKHYPIIAYVYPGPQTESVLKTFDTRGDRTWRLAQFGFIVITVGNRGGHPSRSKWYHNYGYGNLRDYGLSDKKAAIEQLAMRHPFINIDKVGIFGHSGGGFMSTAAMLVYPDFFKVAVSSSGNHENNIYNRWWSEKHHGVQEIEDKEGNVTFKYDIEKNSEIAKNLKGRLLIVTGDIDNNVHPANTIRLANALIKANKRFDFFLFPGQRHGYGNMNEYFFWLRADYFCKHLIGDYSQEVNIKELNNEVEKIQ